MGQWFLDKGLMQDFGILDMNGIRAAYRAVKTPPPFCLGGPPVLIPPATDECEDEAPERPYVCPECNGAFETCQLVAHQTHKHGYRHPPGIVTVTNTCVWCRNNYRDRRATCLHHQQSWKREYCSGRGSHLHTVVIPVNTTCSHCDQHFEPVTMLLEHLRTVFPLDRRNAELGLDAGAGNAGGEATETEAPSRRTGATDPHDACEARRTFGAGEQSGHETLRDQIEEGTAANGRAARLRMGCHDDGFDHGPSTSPQKTSRKWRHTRPARIHRRLFCRASTGANSKKHFRRTGSSGSVPWTPRLSPSCASSSKP